MADVATDIDLAGRLGEREVGRSHTDSGVGAEHLPGEKQDGLLEVSEGDVLVDIQSLDLVENAVGTGRNSLVTEHSTWADNPDREFHGLHRAYLH